MERDPGAAHNDSRDTRTQEGESARPTERRDTQLEDRVQAPPQDPVTASRTDASPSSYAMDNIEEGEVPLDEEMGAMIDPGIGQERLGTNMDVMDLDPSWRQESEEPDFMDNPGTSDIIEAVEEAEPYFPPTDPPLRTGGLQNVEMMGGFSGTSLEGPDGSEDEPLRLGGDEELAEKVQYALASDAYTAELHIQVNVEDGVVYLRGQVNSLDDIDQAEQVAGSIPGVEEVQEELEIV